MERSTAQNLMMVYYNDKLSQSWNASKLQEYVEQHRYPTLIRYKEFYNSGELASANTPNAPNVNRPRAKNFQSRYIRVGAIYN